MEPVWPTGQSEIFVDRFLGMTADSPTQALAYAQLGQENSFGWSMMRKAYPMQMMKLAQIREKSGLIVETMGATGRRFQRSFKLTPTQAQVMLEDPMGNDPPERTVWYQSRFLRANLHFRGPDFYLRDLHVYDDRYPQPFLTDPVRIHGIDQRMLAVLDGYHWSDGTLGPGHGGKRATGHFILLRQDGSELPLMIDGLPVVEEDKSSLRTRVPLKGGGALLVLFKEREIEFNLLKAPAQSRLLVRFDWNAERSALKQVSPSRLDYRFRDFDYSVSIAKGTASRTGRGVDVVGTKYAGFRILMAQTCC
jgi:hypothetical protein